MTFTFNKHTADPDRWSWVYAYRQALVIGWFFVRCEWQLLPTGETEWRPTGSGWSLWLARPVWWEEDHCRYDGANCLYRFLCFGFERHGLLHDCRKCYGGGE